MITDLLSPQLFGNEAGEDEDLCLLSSYFVDKPLFKPFYSDQNKLMIARARKGIGKSALLRKTFAGVCDSDTDIAIYLKGSDLIALQQIDSDTPHHLIFGWQQRICSRITLEIGKRLKLALSDDTITLVESAELAGFKGRNVIGSLLDRLKLKLSNAEIELSKITPADTTQLLNRYLENKKIKVWVFIDDIDATFINTADQKLLISTFFSACRYLVNDVDGLMIRSSIRSDVWSVICDDEAMDKCEQYMVDITWSTRETGDILKKKILSYFLTKYPNSKKYQEMRISKNKGIPVYNLVFKTPFPWGKKMLPPDKPIHIMSAGRPRWAAQLCKLAGKHAATKNHSLIRITDVSKVMDVYGRSRLSDLYKEHAHQCSKLVDIIESFSGCQRRYATVDLLTHITNRIIKRFGLPKIDGIEQGRDSLYISHFLFRVGFIYGRNDTGDAPLSFVNYDERPDLLVSTANLDDGLTWEIHPSYRQALKIK